MIKIFNSLSGQKEEFVPLSGKRVSYYVCGVTPYDLSHLGHARTYVTFDVVLRHLRARGFETTYVRNFTDVDDKIIKRANEEGTSPLAYAQRFIDAYHVDMDALGIAHPSVEPKVSESIGDIIQLVERLVKNGHAYVVDGDVYFSVVSFPEYLKLSKRSADEMEAGARVDVDPRKKNPMDFALWKSAKPGEIHWPSPWGDGRPGWHIECSAMAFRHLGETIDIHAGGRDLIFPHHENEIAQSEAASHKPFAKYWMHSGMLNIDDTKMSKSLGNFFTIREVLRRSDAEALRAFYLNAHYRGPMSLDLDYFCPTCGALIDRPTAESLHHEDHDFSREEANAGVRFTGIEDAAKRLFYVYRTLAKADAFVGDGPIGDGPVHKPEVTDGIYDRFAEALDDDFNSAAAISSLSAALSYLNELCDKPPKPRDQSVRTAARIAAAVRKCGETVGLYQKDAATRVLERSKQLVIARKINVAAVDALIEKRAAARAEKRFADADAARAELATLGVVVKDTPSGSVWEVGE